MLAYLTEKIASQVELKVTGFDYQGSLDETDVTGYDVIPSYREFISSFEERADTQDLLFITGSLYFISEVRATCWPWSNKLTPFCLFCYTRKPGQLGRKNFPCKLQIAKLIRN